MKKLKVPKIAEENGNGEVRVKNNAWHFFSKAMPLIFAGLMVLSFLWGRIKGMVVSGEYVKEIPAMKMEAKELGSRMTVAEVEIKTLPEVKKKVDDLEKGQFRILGKLDVLIGR